MCKSSQGFYGSNDGPDCTALAEPAAAPATVTGPLPANFIDPEHSGTNREMLEEFYAATFCEGGTDDEITLRGINAVLARWGQPPAPPTERHAAPMPKLALAPANDYKSRWLEEDGVMKPVINWIHTIPIEDKDIFHCAQSSCWCSPKVDKDNPEIIIHQALTSAQDGWVLIGEIEAVSEKSDSAAGPPPSELIAELIPELRKVAEHLRDCNFRGFSNCVTRTAELLAHHAAPVPVAERLPGPEDCISNPRNGQGQWCWGWCVEDAAVPFSGRWRMLRVLWLLDEATHWLPAHALPLPAPQGGEVE